MWDGMWRDSSRTTGGGGPPLKGPGEDRPPTGAGGGGRWTLSPFDGPRESDLNKGREAPDVDVD